MKLRDKIAKQAKLNYTAPKGVVATLTTASTFFDAMDKEIRMQAWRNVVQAWETFHKAHSNYSQVNFVRCIYPALPYNRDDKGKVKGYKGNSVYRSFENALSRCSKAKKTTKGKGKTPERQMRANLLMNQFLGILLDVCSEQETPWEDIMRIVRRHIPEEAFEQKMDKGLESYTAPLKARKATAKTRTVVSKKVAKKTTRKGTKKVA
tara:strand:+ start:1751 stop:2371 length:621 start_codon:yes stop_codon:yes gene_type:complete